MKVNQSKTVSIILQIAGVLVAIILIAAIVFSAYRFGIQRGMLAVSEAMASSSEIEDAPWAVPSLQWHEYSFFENLVMVLVAIFLLRVVIGLVFGFRPYSWHVSRFHRWLPCRYGRCSYGFWDSLYREDEDSVKKEDAPAS